MSKMELEIDKNGTRGFLVCNISKDLLLLAFCKIIASSLCIMEAEVESVQLYTWSQISHT